MIVVSNTSPIISLAAIGQFNLLHHLYKHVHIPQSVEILYQHVLVLAGESEG